MITWNINSLEFRIPDRQKRIIYVKTKRSKASKKFIVLIDILIIKLIIFYQVILIFEIN